MRCGSLRGMLMKAALLSSLSYRPKLLVLDEFIRGVLEVSALGEWTVLVSSHDILVNRAAKQAQPASTGEIGALLEMSSLLAAKTIGVLLMVGFVPIVVSLPWWLWCGFGLGQIASVAGEMLLILMLAMLPATVMAVLTDSLGRALLWSVALVAVVWFVGFFFTAAVAMTRTGTDLSLMATRIIVALVLVTANLAAVVVTQFFVRQRGWRLGVAGAVLIGSTFVAMQWPWSLFPREPRGHHAERAADGTVAFHRALAEPPPSREKIARLPRGVIPTQRVAAQFVGRGMPADVQVNGLAARQRWGARAGLEARHVAGRHHDARGSGIFARSAAGAFPAGKLSVTSRPGPAKTSA